MLNNEPVPPPGRSTTLARLLGFARGLLNGKVIAAVLVLLALELVAADDKRPSRLFGRFIGGLHAWEIDASKEQQADLARRMADAQAEAMSKWAIEQELARQQQEAILRSLAAKQDAAPLADYACMAGSIAGALWGRDATSFEKAAKLACDEGDRLRREIVLAQAEAARIGSGLMQRPSPIPQASSPAVPTTR